MLVSGQKREASLERIECFAHSVDIGQPDIDAR
jgi:hypothetical protein